MPLRVAAISFLNPAPLLFSFEHEPLATELRSRYTVHYTTPAQCAAQLRAGEADLGLIPIAELTPELAVVPGCTIASQNEVRSILLLVRYNGSKSEDQVLRGIRTVAADTASRSSIAYLQVLLRHFYGSSPKMDEHPADPVKMLSHHDAALLIGDPALLAREQRTRVDQDVLMITGERLLWLDLARWWHDRTGLPWVAAVWAVRPEALPAAGNSAAQLTADLIASRDAGLAHTEQLVKEWRPRLALSEATIRTYLTQNIYYILDDACTEAIRTFRSLASETGVLPPLPELRLLNGIPVKT